MVAQSASAKDPSKMSLAFRAAIAAFALIQISVFSVNASKEQVSAMSEKLKIMQERIVQPCCKTKSKKSKSSSNSAKPWTTAQYNGATRFIPHQLSSWHLQLQGTVDFNLKRDVIDVDLFDTNVSDVASIHKLGGYAIAYFNGGAWQPDKPDSDMYPDSVIGTVPMDGWPQERWLDIRQISILRPLIRNKLLLAKSKGFNAVDPDNMDGYSNSKEFGLTKVHQIAFNRMVAQEAKSLGLAVFLKNTDGLVDDLVQDFDGAVVEEAFRYNEAAAYQPFRDNHKPVFEVEYRAFTRAQVKEATARGFNCIQGKLSLDGPTKQVTFY